MHKGRKNLLIINSKFKSCGTPIDKLNCPARFNGGNSLIGISRNNITTIQQCTSHVMCGTRITYNHLIVWLETLESDILNAVTLMLRFGFRNDWGAGNKRVVNTWIGNQICLEFSEVNVQRAFEAEGRSDGGDNCVLEGCLIGKP
jgi:hypothetical protein